MKNIRKSLFEGIRDGIPIMLGYFAVSFPLGIAMHKAGMNVYESMLMSALEMASAGQYAGVQIIAAAGTYFQMALITLIANARYLLMSCAYSQKLSEDTPLIHRLGNGFTLTDEIFGIAMARTGKADVYYFYGAMLAAIPGWTAGSALGCLFGSILPSYITAAFGVALYGMFLAIIIPPCRTDSTLTILVAASFLCSFIASVAPVISGWSDGTRTIVLTILLASAAAVIKPVKDEEEEQHAQ